MRNKKIIKQNTAAINEFIIMFGSKDTARIMSEFLFELQGLYLTRSDVSLSDEGADYALTRFDILYRLVNGIQAVEKDS